MMFHVKNVLSRVMYSFLKIVKTINVELHKMRLKYFTEQRMVLGSKVLKPWGLYSVYFVGKKCLIKKLIIKPEQQISYQSHNLRNEHWIVIKGKGKAILNDQERNLNKNEYLYIPSGIKHRVMNTGSKDMVIIEIQTGIEFLEEDIIRYEDDYNRIEI